MRTTPKREGLRAIAKIFFFLLHSSFLLQAASCGEVLGHGGSWHGEKSKN